MRLLIKIILNLIVITFTLVGIGVIALYSIGIVPTIVTSGSMEPTIPTGSLCIIDRRVPLEEIQLGDIIVYKLPQQKVIHRVYEITEEGVNTKGDANKHVDGLPTTKENYYGKYLYSFPKIGYYINELQFTEYKIMFISILIALYISCFYLNRKKE